MVNAMTGRRNGLGCMQFASETAAYSIAETGTALQAAFTAHGFYCLSVKAENGTM